MRQLTVQKNDSSQRLDKFMQKRFRNMPESLLYKYLRKNCVKVNGIHACGKEILHTGDVLTFYINNEFFEQREKADFSKIKPSFGVAYEDENILIADKPAGLICQSDAKESFNTLINHILAYLSCKGEYLSGSGEAFVPALCNRIDKNTEGLVIAAKNADALRIMNEKIKNRELHKYYECFVFGVPVPDTAVKTAYLKKTGDGDGEDNFVKITEDADFAIKNGYRQIKTGYKTVETDGTISKLRIELFTGRTHQIRAHMAYLGHPLLGDTKYGSNAQNDAYFKDKAKKLRHQALASCELFFDFETDGGSLQYLDKKRIFRKQPFSLA